MATHRTPFHTLRSSGMKAAIWLNDGITGPFFSTTFSRTFKDRTGPGATPAPSASATLRRL